MVARRHRIQVVVEYGLVDSCVPRLHHFQNSSHGMHVESRCLWGVKTKEEKKKKQRRRRRRPAVADTKPLASSCTLQNRRKAKQGCYLAGLGIHMDLKHVKHVSYIEVFIEGHPVLPVMMKFKRHLRCRINAPTRWAHLKDPHFSMSGPGGNNLANRRVHNIRTNTLRRREVENYD